MTSSPVICLRARPRSHQASCATNPDCGGIGLASASLGMCAATPPRGTDRLPYFSYAMFAGFALTALVGPMMNNAGLYWIAIELTTLVSTLLVALRAAKGASG